MTEKDSHDSAHRSSRADQDAHRSESIHGSGSSHATGVSHDTVPIDPVISEPSTDTTLIPVVRPSEAEEDEGFVKSLTGSIASSWRSAAEEATLEWEEYDAEAVARAAEEAEAAEAESVRHEFPDDFDLAASAEPATSSAPAVSGPSTGGINQPPTVPSSPVPPSTALDSVPLRRRSVLRPSWLKPKLGNQFRKGQILDRAVFERRVSPQHVFRRIMQTERPVTTQISLVDRLVGTPYENPHQAEHPVDADELETIAFVLDLGEALFRYGAGALEVESSIIAVTAAFGMKNTDADITNQSIILNWAPEGKIPYTRVRVVRSWSSNFKALAAVHELVTDIIAGRLTRSEAEQRLEEITREPKPYPRWLVTLAGAVFASFFASFLGAPLLDAALGFAATIMVLWTTRQLTAWRVPEFYTLAAGGFVASGFAMAAFMLDAEITPSMVVAGGLMILLPSARIVSAIQDAINGFPITSAGRLVSAMIAFAGMTSGIMAAVVIADLLGAPPIEIAEGLTRIYHPTIMVGLVFFAALAAAIVEQSRWRMVLPTAIVSALGFIAFYAGEMIGLGDRVTPLIGATVVGALGRVVALRMGAPQLVVAVPAMMFMLPGLMVFRGMYQIAIENSSTFMMAGLFQLFNALIIILAIAAGIVLGDVMMRPFTSSLQSNERARGRRR
ncbi:threonine/serine exporter family protein [Nesterenkonia flava]|uniref:Threonine/serine exporter family protein n=1 Tax=Nesterenkonia flava TaxID=469799 RepID=A0ABU1FWI8_9MICC|nr:threonine/serine exporter family protein [Nesterenkonia flava]MDR5712612.1 threonine/serine exporter family protein [Nesterenkonia flava]